MPLQGDERNRRGFPRAIYGSLKNVCLMFSFVHFPAKCCEKVILPFNLTGLACLTLHRRKKEKRMPTSDRRITPRFNLRTPLSFRRMEAPSKQERASAINISTRGVYFITNLDVCVGEAIEILLEVPKRVTGTRAINRRFAGRVAHVESNMPKGQTGIGVQLLYYEHDLVAPALAERSSNEVGPGDASENEPDRPGSTRR